jgi:hypothetical protein
MKTLIFSLIGFSLIGIVTSLIRTKSESARSCSVMKRDYEAGRLHGSARKFYENYCGS